MTARKRLFAAAIAAFPGHGVQAAGGQRREPGQHLSDERQIGIDLRCALRRPDARQAGLRKHPADGFGVHVQLPGDRSGAPFFDMVIAQDLRLEVSRNGHDRVLLVCSDGPGVAETLAAHRPNNDDHSACSTNPACAEAVGCPRATVVHRPPPDPRSAQHAFDPRVNRDASLYFRVPGFSGPGSDATAPHA